MRQTSAASTRACRVTTARSSSSASNRLSQTICRERAQACSRCVESAGWFRGLELGVLKLHLKKIALLSAVLGASLACAESVQAQPASPAPENGALEVEQVFAGTCGFCHSDGGR